MLVGLYDVDSHNFPNIAQMKISAYHKSIGDKVEVAMTDKHYDKLYISKVFTESVEKTGYLAEEVIRGGSGYDLINKLPPEIEHMYPDYSIYPDLTKDKAYGILTRGCPRVNHTFCITPKKDGCRATKVANLTEFWNGQKEICLLDQNILACKDRIELLQQLSDSKAKVEFNGGLDVRYMNEDIINLLKSIKIHNLHLAWDDPREELFDKFKLVVDMKLANPRSVGVYVLVNYWSTIEQDLERIYKLRDLGYSPYVMIYDKQKFVNDRGKMFDDVMNKYTIEQLIHFKTCQHMQRWCNSRNIFRMCKDFYDYSPFKNCKTIKQLKEGAINAEQQ